MDNSEDLASVIYNTSPPPITIEQIKAAMATYEETEGGIESEEFYNLMQNYRHTPITDPEGTLAAYHAVIAHIEKWHLDEMTDQAREHSHHEGD